MLHFLSKTLLHPRNGYTFTAHNPNPSTVVSLSLIRCFSSDADNPHSFTVSYRINSCGLSSKSALIAAKSVQFKSPENPDLIISFFQKLGFSKPQISEMIIKSPEFLSYNPQKFIFPKVEFFHSKVPSIADLARIFTAYPWILRVSLENQLVPSFNLLVDLFESEYKAIELIKQNPRVLTSGLEAALIPVINILRKHGVPASNISFLFLSNWQSIGNSVKFGEITEEVKEMGFNPLKLKFVRAIAVLASMSKPTRDKKVEVYKSWGWSDKDITTAFKKYPQCMTLSEDNIMAKMDFYVNKLGLDSSVVLNRPLLLAYSLKKRLIPRAAVIRYLSSKGLVKWDSRITIMFECTENYFLEKYVNCLKEEAPHVIDLYNEMLDEAMSEGKGN
ncbi:uncharacterized protein [Euphorbia lathyris]|uniref:uncharacterized protein n=1 Tax=Euphorbia lathyris TaxID=212925 RepID=UPI00331348F7